MGKAVPERIHSFGDGIIPHFTPPNPKYVAKPYEQMQFPGQRVQIDVKFVPEVCMVGDAKGKKFYQYTAAEFS